MLFGALTLAVSTTVTSCKDYDDDVKNLQEQIDKITSTNPVSTEDMKAAIASAISTLQAQLQTAIDGKADSKAVQDLLATVTELQTALDNKADASKIQELGDKITALTEEVNAVKGNLEAKQEELAGKVAELEEQLKEAASSADIARLTEDLAAAKNELKTVKEMAENNAAAIVGIQTSITQLKTLEGKVAALEAFKATAATQEDLKRYVETSDLADLVDAQVLNLLKDNGSIAQYVNDAIEAQVLSEASAINVAIKGINTELATLSADFEAYKGTQTTKYNDLSGKITALETFKNDITNSLAGTTYKDFADMLAEIASLRSDYANCITTSNLGASVNTYLSECIGKADTAFGALEMRVAALEKRIQSVTYVPTTTSRNVNFTTLYAKRTATDPDYSTIALKGASTQKVMFRISPASAAKSFDTNYDVIFSADQEIADTRSAIDQFVVVGEPEIGDGFVTYTILSNATKSYAVCMNVKTKEAKEGTLGTVDITSDYFAALISEQYVVDASYKVATDIDQDIVNSDNTSTVDYASGGNIMLSVSDNVDGSNPVATKLSVYPGFDLTSLKATFSVTNPTLFKITDGVVALKTYGIPSTVGLTTDVKAKVTATGFYTPAADTKIGTVNVVIDTKAAIINYGEIKVTWNNARQTIAATKFPLNLIYDDPKVLLTPTEFKALTGAVVSVAGAKAAFEIGTDNVLSATVAAQAPAGSYPIQATFKSDGREITVNATIKVENPTFASLEVDPVLWKGSATAGSVEFTPTLDAADQPLNITLAYDLSELFTNYADVLTAVNATPGAKLEITVPDYSNIPGLSYNAATTVLTFDKDTYTGKTADDKVAKVQVVANVTLNGTTGSLQSYKADVSINNISGSWKAGKQTVELENKAATVNLSKDFVWNDMRGKAMWKDGAAITAGTDFAATIKGLSLYGLTDPKFSFVDAEGEATTSKYLAINASTGELTFTETGKTFNFQIPVEVFVKVSASSQWGVIEGYAGKDIITVTIPAGIR